MAKSMLKNMRLVHPEEILRDNVILALGCPKTEIARLLGISCEKLYDILKERQPVTA
jgi:plasmid maintenance system antidote protein VapI